MAISEELKTTTPYDEFLQTRREEITRINYRRSIETAVGDPNTFLELARTDKKKGEEIMIAFVVSRRDNLSPTSIHVMVSGVKSFLDYHDVLLNWKKIRSIIGPANNVALDRAPTVEEIRDLYNLCDLRMSVSVLVFASSGIRIAALTGMNVGDVKFLDSGLGRLTVYANTRDEYHAFITEEAVKAIRDYYDARTKIGEILNPSSPFIRDKWSYGRKHNRLDPTIAKRVSTHTVWQTLNDLWEKAGVREIDDKRRRKDFKCAHGFRKWFKTQAGQGLSNRDDSEVLLGHRLNYYKPTLEHLEKVYLEAQPFFVISEVQEVKQFAEAKNKVHNEEIKDVRLLLFDKDQQLKRLQGIVEKIGEEHESMKVSWNEIKPELERLRKSTKQN